jgi:predicted ATPase/DNA-binding SARP family transcriptional activator
VEFRLLGPFEAVRQGEAIALGGAKQRALLARLLLSANEVVSRDRLIEDLWGDDQPKDAAHTIQVFVSQLRKVLGREAIETQAPGYLVRATDDELDLLRFEASRARGRERLEAGDAVSAEATLAEALALFRGQPLADFAYQAWAEQEANRVEEARIACQEDVVEARLALGRGRDVLGELEALIASHPLRERPRGQLMLALYREGRQAEALDCYQQTRALLDAELGIEPGAELKELHRRILNQDPTLAPAMPPAAPRTTLPTPATSFLGRARDLDEVKKLLGRADVRLLTLTGPGGTGKTRLAIQAAGELAASYPDGVFWVPLASLNEADLVLSSVARALDSAEQELREHVGNKRMLLVLDNFEQVVGAAPDVADLLSACPRLEILVTSRESLHLSGEQTFPVPPLESGDGVELFFTRARALEPGFEANGVVGELCSRLDNLPLAIELAAARSSLFTPEQLVSRLAERLDLFKGARDLDPRQHTLRTTIAWSYELLSDEERTLFARLAVFAGGCTYEAAEQVANADPDVLQSLIEKSLVRRTEGRYWMLETIREFAAERLAATGQAEESRKRHGEWILELTKGAREGLRGPDAAMWLTRLDDNLENLRACFAWLHETGQFELELDLVENIWWFWSTRGHFQEGRRWADEALARTTELRNLSRATVLHAAASLAIQVGDIERTIELAREGMSLSTEIGDFGGIAGANMNFAIAAAAAGDYDEAERLFGEAIENAGKANEPRLAAWGIGSLADIALRQRDYERAAALSHEAIDAFRRVELEEGVGFALCNLALALFRAAREEEALASARDALSIGHGLGDVQTVMNALLVLASLGWRRGEPQLATRLLGAADRIREQTGISVTGPEELLWDEVASELRVTLAEEYEAIFAEGRSTSVDDAVELALGRTSLV